MEGKITKYILSSVLAIALFVAEIVLMVQYNVSRGITKQDVNRIIDTYDLEIEIKKAKEYKELESQIDSEMLQEIIESEELNNYIKGNVKSLYGNILYNEKNEYINNEELKQYINNTITKYQETIEITDQDIETIDKNIDIMTKEIEQNIEEVETHKSEIKIISDILSPKTTTYIVGVTVLIGIAIISLNKSKDGYMWVGLTTIIVGIIFFVLWLSLSKTINTTGIDEKIIRYVSKYLPTFLKTL